MIGAADQLFMKRQLDASSSWLDHQMAKVLSDCTEEVSIGHILTLMERRYGSDLRYK